MMKWRRTKSVNSIDYVDCKISNAIARVPSTSDDMCLDGKENTLNRNDSFSAYDDIHLHQLYKQFRTNKTNDNNCLSELENNLELYKNLLIKSPSKSKAISRQLSPDRHRSPIILPSIDENDELLSIADSGISCDGDDESDFENDNPTILKAKFDFDSLKDDSNTEIYDDNEKDSLFLSAHAFRRRDSSRNFSGKTIPRLRSQHKLYKSNSAKRIPQKLIFDNPDEIKSQETSNQKIENEVCPTKLEHSCLEDFNKDKVNTSPDTCNNKISEEHIISEIPSSLVDTSKDNNTVTDKKIESSHDTANIPHSNTKATYEQVKQYLSPKMLNHTVDDGLSSIKDVKQYDYLQHSLMSSILWSGETSLQAPSSERIYSTMPPNRYTEVNKESTKQIEQTECVETPKEFKVNLNIHLYKPEEILIGLEDGKLVVSGKHFSESEYGFECCQFHRRFPIPAGFKKSDIKSKVSDDGVLTITGKRKLDEGIKTDLENSNNDNPLQSKDDLTADASGVIPQITQTIIPAKENNDATKEHQFKLVNNLYILKVDCKGYSAEDLDVRILRGELIVRATKPNVKEGEEDKELRKCYILPHDADCDTIISKYRGKNTLQVEVKKYENMDSLNGAPSMSDP